MTKKMEKAITALYNDGLKCEDVSSISVNREKRKYVSNGILYLSNSCGTFNESGSFLCAGSYAVMIKGQEAYNTFFGIQDADNKHYKQIYDINRIYQFLRNYWQKYLNGKFSTIIKEGNLPKDWKKQTIHKQVRRYDKKVYMYNKYNKEVYMIDDVMLSKKYLDHATRFLKSDIHWITIGDRLQPVFLTDGENIAVILPIRY